MKILSNVQWESIFNRTRQKLIHHIVKFLARHYNIKSFFCHAVLSMADYLHLPIQQCNLPNWILQNINIKVRSQKCISCLSIQDLKQAVPVNRPCVSWLCGFKLQSISESRKGQKHSVLQMVFRNSCTEQLVWHFTNTSERNYVSAILLKTQAIYSLW